MIFKAPSSLLNFPFNDIEWKVVSQKKKGLNESNEGDIGVNRGKYMRRK